MSLFLMSPSSLTHMQFVVGSVTWAPHSHVLPSELCAEQTLVLWVSLCTCTLLKISSLGHLRLGLSVGTSLYSWRFIFYTCFCWVCGIFGVSIGSLRSALPQLSRLHVWQIHPCTGLQLWFNYSIFLLIFSWLILFLVLHIVHNQLRCIKGLFYSV